MRVLAATGRLHIVAIGALGALTFGWVFFGERMPLVAVVAGIDWFLVNLLNRVVDLPEDRANGIVGTDFVAKNRRVLLWGGLGALAASFVGAQLLAPWLWPFRLAFHALGMAYNWPLLPGRRRIKQLYFWKNTASAIGFVLTVFAYPIATGRGAGLELLLAPAGVALTALFFVLFELSYEVLYDLRDAPGDRAAGVATYPVVHGERTATRIVDGLVLASCAVAMGGYVAGAVPWRVVVMIAAPLFQLVYYKVRARGALRAERAKDGATSIVDARDCIRLTWVGAAMLALYNGWVTLGWPGV
ncbi:MAG: UbiA family prenyltransferase [Labilithrix sp.]|nr:UbiA family prenyltransferase [Labilithrix sp.]